MPHRQAQQTSLHSPLSGTVKLALCPTVRHSKPRHECCHLANSVSCHPRATCHIAGWMNSIRHIENRSSPYFIFFGFLMQFELWRSAVFVSSPIQLLNNSSIYSQHAVLLAGMSCFALPCLEVYFDSTKDTIELICMIARIYVCMYEYVRYMSTG